MPFEKIVFRADGNSDIGLGHVFRSLSLLKILKNEFTCVFATNSLGGIKNYIQANAHEFISLPNNETHFDIFINKLTGNEIVVLDNYYYNSEYQFKIKEKGCRLVCIDDIPSQHFYADIILNHSEGITSNQYSKEPYTKCLLGLKYILLGQDFISASSPERNVDLNNIHALVCFGGADPLNLTKKTASQLLTINSINKISVIVGSAYNSKNIAELSISEKVNVYHNIDQKKVVELMTVCDFAVVPSSGIMLEALSMGLPVITGYYVENQKNITKSLSSKKIGLVIGDIRNINLNQKTIYSVFESDYEYLIDRKSPQRIIKEFKKLASGS